MTKATKNASAEKRVYPFAAPVGQLTPDMIVMLPPKAEWVCDVGCARRHAPADVSGIEIVRIAASAKEMVSIWEAMENGDIKMPRGVKVAVNGCEHTTSWIEVSAKIGTIGGAGWNAASIMKAEAKISDKLSLLRIQNLGSAP